MSKELEELFKEENRKRKQWWRGPYYWFWKIYYKVEEFPHNVKYFIQRGKHGYADCDVWSLYEYLCSWMPKALKELRDNNAGCPDFLWDDAHKNPCHKWEDILTKIAKGFEGIRKNDDILSYRGLSRKKQIEKKEKNRKEFKKSMDLFVKYFEHLWD